MSDEMAAVVVVSLAGAMLLGLLVAGGFVLRDTIRGKGALGMNFKPLSCPKCKVAAPATRMPANFRQAMWGGCTCPECGAEYDKWGELVQDK